LRRPGSGTFTDCTFFWLSADVCWLYLIPTVWTVRLTAFAILPTALDRLNRPNR